MPPKKTSSIEQHIVEAVDVAAGRHQQLVDELFDALHGYPWDAIRDHAESLIEQGADPNGMSSEFRNRSLLYIVAESGEYDGVAFLLNAGADVNANNTYSGETALHVACDKGHVDVVSLLLHRGAKVSPPGGCERDTPLHRAARHGHVGIVKLLVESGAELSARTRSGYTPLASAASGDHLKTMVYLLDVGADASGGLNEHTPMEAAIYHGSLNAARLLLLLGLFDLRDPQYEGLLYLAAEGGDVEGCKWLLSKGATILSGRSPLCGAINEDRHEVIDLFLRGGHHLTTDDALLAAAGFGHTYLVHRLLRHGYDVKGESTMDGSTALHAACEVDMVGTAKELIALGADVDATNDDGATPLHVAASNSDNDSAAIFLALLENGAGICVAGDKSWASPLFLMSGSDLRVWSQSPRCSNIPVLL